MPVREWTSERVFRGGASMPLCVAVVVLLLGLAGHALADNQAMVNQAVVDAMSAVIKASEHLSDARRQALCDIVADVLLKSPKLADDKAEHAAEHFRVYFTKRLV